MKMSLESSPADFDDGLDLRMQSPGGGGLGHDLIDKHAAKEARDDAPAGAGGGDNL